MKTRTFCYVGTMLLLTVILIASSCVYKSYMGRYRIGRDSQTYFSREDNSKMLDVVRYISIEFGLTEVEKTKWMPINSFYFSKNNKIRTVYDSLKGSNASISIVVTTGSSPSILVRDPDHIQETEFYRRLRTELEMRLGEVVDMKNVPFRREPDFWN
jgi:hypothetical protein